MNESMKNISNSLNNFYHVTVVEIKLLFQCAPAGSSIGRRNGHVLQPPHLLNKQEPFFYDLAVL